jgi:hypothetical protein
MSHSPIIINDRMGELKGNASTGTMATLQSTFNAAEAAFPNYTTKQKKRHEEISEALQAWLTTTGSYQGACGEVTQFTTWYNTNLP